MLDRERREVHGRHVARVAIDGGADARASDHSGTAIRRPAVEDDRGAALPFGAGVVLEQLREHGARVGVEVPGEGPHTDGRVDLGGAE